MAPTQFKQSPTSAKTLASSQDKRILVRETMQLSANLATSSHANLIFAESCSVRPEVKFGLVEEVDSRVICCEELDGRRWKYVAESDGLGRFIRNSMHAVALHTPSNPVDELISFVIFYVVPEGFPDGVSPSYVPYMSWRALKHFFGGAMSVFTTRSLLHSVGISGENASSAAVAINWVLKLGTGLSMMISKKKSFLGGHFCIPVMWIYSRSYRDEVGCIAHIEQGQIHCCIAVDSFLKTGNVPSLKEGNLKENIFSLPWLQDRPIVLGPRFKDASQEPAYFVAIESLFEDQAKSDDILQAAFHADALLHFIRLSNGNKSLRKRGIPDRSGLDYSLLTTPVPRTVDFGTQRAESCRIVSTSYGLFRRKAAEQDG